MNIKHDAIRIERNHPAGFAGHSESGRTMKHVIYNRNCTHSIMDSWHGYFSYYGRIHPHPACNCYYYGFAKNY